MTKNLIPVGDTSVTLLQKPVIAISEDEKEAIKDAIDKWATKAKLDKIHKAVGFIAERDKLLVDWLFHTGMRISDALQIKYMDIRMDKEEVTYLVKKRSKNKPFFNTISLEKSILFEVQRFKDQFLIKPEERLFRITRQTFDDNLSKYCQIAGIRKYSAHKFRHGMAMKDLEQGIPDFVTSYRLAHSSTSVTNSTYRRMNADIERSFRKKRKAD